MSRIEAGLHAYHASAANSNAFVASATAQSQLSALSQRNEDPARFCVEPPFAKINSVVDGSPADRAGLKAGDEVRQFGEINWRNHEKLSKVAQVVQRNEGVSNTCQLHY